MEWVDLPMEAGFWWCRHQDGFLAVAFVASLPEVLCCDFTPRPRGRPHAAYLRNGIWQEDWQSQTMVGTKWRRIFAE